MKTVIKNSVVLNEGGKIENAELEYNLLTDSLFELSDAIKNNGKFLVSISDISSPDIAGHHDVYSIKISVQKLPEHATEIVIK